MIRPKPILIAHRGLFEGPNLNLENAPEQIMISLDEGYNAEIDVWFDETDGSWWLGHDEPVYETNYDFLSLDGLWIHCKNMQAMAVLASDPKKHAFWHQNDDITLTTKRYLWTYPGKRLFRNSVWVQPEWDTDWERYVVGVECFGICSKYVKKIKEMIG